MFREQHDLGDGPSTMTGMGGVGGGGSGGRSEAALWGWKSWDISSLSFQQVRETSHWSSSIHLRRIGPLQLVIHGVQNRHAGEQWMQCDKPTNTMWMTSCKGPVMEEKLLPHSQATVAKLHTFLILFICNFICFAVNVALCTEWPGSLDLSSVPLRITTRNYLFAGPSLYHPGSRKVKLQVL